MYKNISGQTIQYIDKDRTVFVLKPNQTVEKITGKALRYLKAGLIIEESEKNKNDNDSNRVDSSYNKSSNVKDELQYANSSSGSKEAKNIYKKSVSS